MREKIEAWVLFLMCGAVGLGFSTCLEPAHADPEPVVERAAASPVPEPRALPPDPDALALAARMRAWQPLWRERRPGELEEVAATVVAACRRDPWPTPERCPDLVAAVAFRESSWRADAVGARGERGLMQLLPGVATGGETAEAASDPEVNVRLGIAHLRRAQALCRFVGRGDVSTALGMYGSGRCRTYRGSRLVERWERELAGSGP